MAHEFSRLIDSDPEEPLVQAFLELHPVMICGSDYVMAKSVISKLPLGRDHVPDFVYVNPQSGLTFVHLFEIKKPAMSIFTKADEFSKPFCHAYQQVEDYVGWCQRNADALIEILRPLDAHEMSRIGIRVAKGHLIYGRRREINSVRRKERWQQRVGASQLVTLRTYDGFAQERERFMQLTVEQGYSKSVAYKRRSYVELPRT